VNIIMHIMAWFVFREDIKDKMILFFFYFFWGGGIWIGIRDWGQYFPMQQVLTFPFSPCL
jgi:hypothetical protein